MGGTRFHRIIKKGIPTILLAALVGCRDDKEDVLAMCSSLDNMVLDIWVNYSSDSWHAEDYAMPVLISQ